MVAMTQTPFSVFCAAATVGRGSIPILPDDVRHLIWTHTFPRPIAWCSSCGTEVIVRLENGYEVPVNSHVFLWLETPRCRWCTGYPHPHGGE